MKKMDCLPLDAESVLGDGGGGLCVETKMLRMKLSTQWAVDQSIQARRERSKRKSGCLW